MSSGRFSSQLTDWCWCQQWKTGKVCHRARILLMKVGWWPNAIVTLQNTEAANHCVTKLTNLVAFEMVSLKTGSRSATTCSRCQLQSNFGASRWNWSTISLVIRIWLNGLKLAIIYNLFVINCQKLQICSQLLQLCCCLHTQKFILNRNSH